MNNLSSFWKSFEALPHGGARLEAWQRTFGAELFERVASRYLRPAGGIVARVGCERTRRTGDCAYRVVEHEDGTVAGVCDQGRCERTIFKREDLAAFTLNEDRLVEDIALLPGITPRSAAVLPGPGANRHIGVIGQDPAAAVILVRQRDREDCERFLSGYFRDHPQRTVVVAPTRRHLGGLCGWDRLLEPFYLEDHFKLKGDQLIPTRQGLQAWQNILGRLSGSATRPALPEKTRWHDLILRFIDGHTLAVKANSFSARYTYLEMGMVDKRDKCPDSQWDLLRSFASEHGSLDWSSKAASLHNKKRKQRLSRCLKAFFGIPGEPFRYNAETGGWESVFTIIPE